MSGLRTTNRPGTGIYTKGSERIYDILLAAHTVLVRDGYQRLTMRAIARETDMTIGNLNYYYSSKSDLLRDLIEHVIAQYLADFEEIREESDRAPEAQLKALLQFIVEDIGTKETTHFFPELWALSNHDEAASESMHALYRKARQVFEGLIAEINPGLTKSQVRKLSLIVSASLEGLTVFVGHDKPFARQRKTIGNVTIKGLLDLIRNVETADFK